MPQLPDAAEPRRFYVSRVLLAAGLVGSLSMFATFLFYPVVMADPRLAFVRPGTLVAFVEVLLILLGMAGVLGYGFRVLQYRAMFWDHLLAAGFGLSIVGIGRFFPV